MLFNPYRMGMLTIRNRIVMPPMSRARAGKGEVATPAMATYYQQRASAGLIISESTQISEQGRGYAWTPGIHTRPQLEGWQQVTQAVHEEGGLIFAQLFHGGRISHTSLQPGRLSPVSASALLAPDVKVFIDTEGLGPERGVGGMIQHSLPRALRLEEIPEVVDQFVQAARNAIAAGFDGVELHGANGYLINQFINSQSNLRTDTYGGNLSNRLRFLQEVTSAVVNAVGRDFVGVRLSPFITLKGCVDDDPETTYLAAVKELENLRILYVHFAEAEWEDAPIMPLTFKKRIRLAFSGSLIYSGLYTKTRAQEALADGWADLIGFGRPFIANPDLPYRLANDLPLNDGDRSTYFGGGERGYLDYPTFPSRGDHVH